MASFYGLSRYAQAPMAEPMSSGGSHPDIGHLVLLVFEAVMEVVCVSLPGYIIARLGHFDADKQKFLANLNIMLFTPCLIFTKLASQLTPDKFAELGVIPVIFVIMTAASYMVSVVVSRLFGFNKRASNFVIAMGVFGNSNSLPISLVISLSQTLQGLHWDKIPGDNDDEVAARGILYLLIFQQLGQLVRWSWGYHVLLAPKSKYPEYAAEAIEEGTYHDDPADTTANGHPQLTKDDTRVLGDDTQTSGEESAARSPRSEYSDDFEPAGRTPVFPRSRGSPSESDTEEGSSSSQGLRTPKKPKSQPIEFPAHGHDDGMLSFPRIRNISEGEAPQGLPGVVMRVKTWRSKAESFFSTLTTRAYNAMPRPVQKVLSFLEAVAVRTYGFLYDFMNPPLWAMLIAVIVASFPNLQALFFQEGSFIKNSVTSAVTQTAGVAVPLILVVLGANLARNTQNHASHDTEETEIGTKLLVASLISRMLLPTLVMAPTLALFAKFVPVSILDDPIFVIVCFLLTGAPSALQLAQICQLNGVFESTMSKILFQSYVIWILPSTLVLVMCALEVVEWAKV